MKKILNLRERERDHNSTKRKNEWGDIEITELKTSKTNMQT